MMHERGGTGEATSADAVDQVAPGNEHTVPWEEFLTLLACPRTGQRLHEGDGGHLVTEDGSHTYPLVDGVPYLVTMQEETPRLLGELLRYRRFFDNIRKGVYQQDRLQIKDTQLKELIPLLRRYFNDVVDRVDLSSAPLLLDTGAGMMETSLELSRRGARVVAADFSPWELHNPRIYSFFDEHGFDWSQYSVVDGYRPLAPEEIVFRRVLASTERLPFGDETFDIVFTRSSLHHLKDIGEGMKEMSRVLKRGGLLLVAGECIRPRWDRESEYLDGILDFQEGIDEQMRTWGEYEGAMRRAGFGSVTAIPALAGGGKRLRRLLGRLRLSDPLERLDGKALSGLRVRLLHATGCALGWTAVKHASPPPSHRLPSEPDPPLARQFAEFERFEKDLQGTAASALDELPSGFNALGLPRPECIGFGPLVKLEAQPVRRIFREAFLAVGSPSGSRTFRMEVFNEGATPGVLVVRSGGTEREQAVSLPLSPGWQTVELPPGRTDSHHASWWLLTESEGLYFRRLY